MSQQDILLETGTNELEIIEFFIHEETERGLVTHYFGVNVAKVLEVVEAPDGLTGSEAAVHPSFLGTIPLRDLILPVVDLSVWLDLHRAEDLNEPIIVTEFNAMITGFLVSGVTQIHRVNWAEVEPPSKYFSSMDSNCITGTIKINDRFVLMLDLEQVLADLDESGSTQANLSDIVSDERYHAMIADDSTSVRELLRTNFTNANFEVTLAYDGAEAWAKLEAIKAQSQKEDRSPLDYLDVVVSDVEMPQMDGYTLTRKIKEDPILKVLPVTLFSSLISKSVLHKGKAVMADAQVTKPEFNGLTAKVIDLIESWREKIQG
ncbi:chemotaxis protein [Pseudodesulfovibrio piezophilus]|uniref:Response regulator receiver modulated CheW protein n=1 Tax=Pseudodesulfovibrio piezophilus (strain DSM 21447 / JCM 15486 / C1TLV30) TaxID=1322246 RepID=M1WS11_PSEP2|nr:chemotaxis protein [Pseudodesulfovibrio piezophilus]CCH49879.1 Response regulator receiver modulated CheW protein [Pseudodesulfovibrio piezophilus C1TLV30]